MPFASSADLALLKDQVAVGLTRGRFGGHVGIIFHSAKDGTRLLHLRFHRLLDSEPFPREAACWIAAVPELHPTNSKILTGIVRSIAARKPGINFGINLFKSNGSFDANGVYKAPRGSDGLTCATFVAQVFHGAGLGLVDLHTWQPRQEDTEWGSAVCALLLEQGADDEHVAVVRSNINGLRLRPEEIAYAAGVPLAGRPVAFPAAAEGGIAVLAILDKLCPGAPA